MLGSTVLELGAGLGVCSVAAKLFGAHRVIATDLEDALEGPRETAALNGVTIDVQALDWTRPRGVQADLIILSDVVWIESLIQPLVTTLKLLLTPSNRAILCYKLRSNVIDAKFKSALAASRIEAREIETRRDHILLQLSSN